MSASKNLFVSVTTWNSAQLLPLCLESLLRTAPDAEVIVLDNESSDDSVSIARKFGV